MYNNPVSWIVDRAVHRDINRAVLSALDWTVNSGFFSYRGVGADVVPLLGAAKQAVAEDPDHPALDDFLLKAETPVGEP